MSGYLLIVLALVTTALSYIVTPIVARVAKKIGIEDVPALPLKQHARATPLLGGAALFLTFILIVGAFFKLIFFGSNPGIARCVMEEGIVSCSGYQGAVILLGIIIGALFLVAGGALDDRYSLPPRFQIITPIIAALAVIFTGIGQDNITNPLYFLGLSSDPLLHLRNQVLMLGPFEFVVWTDVFTLVWLLLLMYATKFLDGLNGLVSGIVVIGVVILFFTGSVPFQPIAVFLTVIVGAIYLGFLPHNMAGKIFLGEGGSTLAGFFLGVLALLSPVKISITLLVLGLPILDLLWVVYERVVKAKKSPFEGDLRHLHFKLLAGGLTSSQAVMLLWIVSFSFGVLGIVFHGSGHAVLLIALLAVMALLIKLTRKNPYLFKSDK